MTISCSTKLCFHIGLMLVLVNKCLTLIFYQLRVSMMPDTAKHLHCQKMVKCQECVAVAGENLKSCEKLPEKLSRWSYVCLNMNDSSLICMNGYEVNSLETPVWNESRQGL